MYNLWVRSFEVIWIYVDQWSKITQIMVNQRKRRIHSSRGFIGSFVDSKWNFNNILSIILAFIKQEKPLIPPLICPFTLQRLASSDFYLWERKCWNFSWFLASPSLCNTFCGSPNIRPSGLWKTVGKPDTGWLIPERVVTSILEKSKGCLNCISFLTGPGIRKINKL